MKRMALKCIWGWMRNQWEVTARAEAQVVVNIKSSFLILPGTLPWILPAWNARLDILQALKSYCKYLSAKVPQLFIATWGCWRKLAMENKIWCFSSVFSLTKLILCNLCASVCTLPRNETRKAWLIFLCCTREETFTWNQRSSEREAVWAQLEWDVGVFKWQIVGH